VPPLPAGEAGLAFGQGLQLWLDLGRWAGVDCGELQTGSFLREFRNKAFREASWTKAPTPETRTEVRDECLWGPERRFVGVFEGRFVPTLQEIELAIRNKLLSGELENLRRIADVPVIRLEDNKAVLGSGETIEFEQLIYADRWASITGIEGVLPVVKKSMISHRKREPAGVLQATFRHSAPIGAGLREGFFAALPKEAGEEVERHVWGQFSTDGSTSFWTLCLTRDETEDVHEITKKLRRMKATAEKMFVDLKFSETIIGEQVRFEEAMLFGEGQPEDTYAEALALSRKMPGLVFLTDGFGPVLAMHQVTMALSPEVVKGHELPTVQPDFNF